MPDSTDPNLTRDAERPVRVVLIGNPNTGKSTLFNALAGMRVRTGNYPGVTVEERIGHVNWQGQAIELVDLPGTYSLSARSPDEMVAVDVLTGQSNPRPDVIVCVCNASALDRHLFLAHQILELDIPVILCLNMWDAVRQGRLTVDCEALSGQLNTPVVCTEAHRHAGLNDLKQQIVNSSGHTLSSQHTGISQWAPETFCSEVHALQEWLLSHDCPVNLATDFFVCRALLDENGAVSGRLQKICGSKFKEQLEQSRCTLRSSGVAVPDVESAQRYRVISELTSRSISYPAHRRASFSENLDSLLTHRVLGLLICVAVMLAVFASISWASAPLSDAIDSGLSWTSDQITAMMSPGPLRSLLTDGVVAGVGSVLVFLPQIAILFLFIAILEDCGYMARAAFLMDRLMALIGLSGRSFLPLMSSFACAVPGIMATRSIENRLDRFVTILVAPLMSCSARLPVYILLTYTFIPDSMLWGWLPLQSLVLLGMSSLGLIVAIPVAFILRRTAFKGQPSSFLLELPDYRIPSARVIFHRVYDSSRSFVVRAGTLIFATTVVIWAIGSYPGDQSQRYDLMTSIENLESDDTEEDAPKLEQLHAQLNEVNATLLENSLLGRMGHAIEPVVKPLGWDWKIGMGVVASLPAREVIIATLGTIYSLGGDVDEESEGLRGAMRASRWPDGSPVFTVPVALSVMVFFALCAQCVSTLAVVRRETNSWKWAAFSFTYMTILAWIGAFITFQCGQWFV